MRLDGVTPQQVLKAFKQIVADQGYRIKQENLDEGTVTTEWRRQMALTYQDGKRRRAEIEAVATSDGRGTIVMLQVPIEYNDEMGEPLSPGRADWKAQGRSVDDEMLIMMRLKMRLKLLRLY